VNQPIAVKIQFFGVLVTRRRLLSLMSGVGRVCVERTAVETVGPSFECVVPAAPGTIQGWEVDFFDEAANAQP
jgi:hypothetical protein